MGRPAELPDPDNPRPIDKARIQQLKSHHRSMARDVVAGGLQNKDLARLYDMTESQISVIVNSPAFIAEAARLEARADDAVGEMREEIRGLVPRARRVLTEDLLLDVEDKNQVFTLPLRKHRASVAFDILNRAGVTKDELKVQELHLHKHDDKHIHGMSTEDLRRDVFDLLKG